jgi:hypothetical protein
MDYREQQVDLIRDRLKSYREQERNRTWIELSSQISEKTAVTISEDVLRQFAYGTERRGRRRVPNPEILEALVSFLSHPDVGMLSHEQLRDAGTR